MTDKPANPFARLDTSLLRSTRPATVASPEEPPTDAPSPPAPKADPETPRVRESKPASNLTSLPARKQASKRASALAVASEGSSAEEAEIIEVVRRTVKTTGKEVGYVRMTPAEKRALKDIAYAYSRQEKRTSDTELIRIAMNCAIEDYRRRGEASMLARVIAALLA